MRAPPFNRFEGIAGALLFATVAAVMYGLTLRHDFVALDDDLLVFANPVVQHLTPSSIAAAFTRYDPELYIPLTFLSFQIDWLLGNGAPWVFHLTNVVLHTINALLVAWLALLLTERRPVALLAGMLFLTHPINAEAVAWVSGRKDLLSSLFVLASVIAWIHWRRGAAKGWRTSVECFALGLLAKVSAIVALPLIVLVEWCEGRSRQRDLARALWPFGGLAALFVSIALGGKAAQLGLLTPWQLLLVGAENIALTLRHFVAPAMLSPFYRHVGAVTLVSSAPSLAVVAALLIAVVALHRRVPLASFAIAWFLVCIAPSIFNAAKAGEVFITSDRYAYLAIIAPMIVAAFAVVQLANLLNPFRGAIQTCVLLLLAFLGGAAQRQATIWENTRTLYQSVLRLDPGIALARNNLGNADLAEANYRGAEAQYRSALELQPSNATARMNLATALEKQKRFDEAESLLRAVIDDAPNDRAEAWYRLGNLFAVQRREADAKAAYAFSLLLNPRFVLGDSALDTLQKE